ncbi:phosphate regulon sensor histidine kinase PhoR [Azospira sp. I09]|jgi:two-component system phosphate regulon sensor histidine kinase PhoR|uniref:phosphate regulon sensor histidine kinase PhoR n=1 Tax=Azospira sp. I09 TaxID=1765049 RepID=UPI001210CB04|nr:phosphate regulon sensor histidine kinase PhoR [Azospira sp. I09]TLS17411.1 MAG: phosphate regulon sensor histidine kinase PhoR [Betaproteobacteria bacterium]BBN89401.1 phosphate regulon sensor histidine kinase PhoR [Azospira sp. I09]
MVKAVWLRAFFFLFLLCAVTGPVWIFVGRQQAWETFCGGLLLYLLYHLWFLAKLMRWLRGPLDARVPAGWGIWEVAFAGLHRRVRIRLEQQHSLARALERFRLAGEALPDGVVVFNRHRQIDGLNAQAAAHFNLNPATDRGQPVTNLIRQPEMVSYLSAGQFDEPLLLQNDLHKGQTLQIQVIPYGDDQNLLISRDISQLERLENMRRDFVANVSHELKTPLTVVSGFVEMLVDDFDAYPREDALHYLRLVQEQSGRMQHLIDDLLTLSALETGSLTPLDERVEVPALLASIQQEAQALSAGRHQISLVCDGPPVLLGCANELRSAFGNLASNAVRYTPDGGRVELIWQRTADGAAFTVADSGIGIAPQHIPRLTERFYRVDRSRSRETGGTGLGLAIVKHVLTRHQGRLEVESEAGKGSRFSACFPALRIPD